ncbi:hypothetical protein PPYR_06658 [Photinus pyralis]|uniref:Uncharacterized protein n=1 Tax=Photinus pyralis TaxID=7054 RepID=A0A1Y1MQK7_PHOPY|nr:hypothetical protein PPYR_06658 [Photinus pyralis]
MKTAIILVACLVGTIYYVQADCDAKTSTNVPFSCGDHGEPHFYEEDGVCHYACLDNGEKKSCPHVHPVKLIEKYIRSRCRQQVFDCNGKGEEFLTESDDHCTYGCKSGDIILTCEQVHVYHN